MIALLHAGSDAASLTLPKSKTRGRRRRLPKPPRFTKSDVLVLILLSYFIANNLIDFGRNPPASAIEAVSALFLTSSLAMYVRAVVAQAAASDPIAGRAAWWRWWQTGAALGLVGLLLSVVGSV